MRAPIGVASIYHYFANKDEVLEDLALDGYAELRQNIRDYRRGPEHGTT